MLLSWSSLKFCRLLKSPPREPNKHYGPCYSRKKTQIIAIAVLVQKVQANKAMYNPDYNLHSRPSDLDLH